MDDIAYLIQETTTGRDEYGNEIIERTPRMVYCRIQTVTQSEFYAAGTDDIKPELELTISHRADYEGENLIQYNGEYYDIIRTYWRGDAVTLTIARRIGITEEASA